MCALQILLLLLLLMHEKGPDYLPIKPQFGNVDLY